MLVSTWVPTWFQIATRLRKTTDQIHSPSECLLKEDLLEALLMVLRVFISIRSSLDIANETVVKSPTTSTTKSYSFLPWWSLTRRVSRTIKWASITPPTEAMENKIEPTLYPQLAMFTRVCLSHQTWQCSLSTAPKVLTTLYPSVRALMRHWSLKSPSKTSSLPPTEIGLLTTVELCSTQANMANYRLVTTRLNKANRPPQVISTVWRVSSVLGAKVSGTNLTRISRVMVLVTSRKQTIKFTPTEVLGATSTKMLLYKVSSHLEETLWVVKLPTPNS